MKLIKQIKLFFREGNSDKVYEIDLCEAGENQYLVNFRFGRRGANLSEGTKTVSPVELVKAEKIFNTLETEKRKKGYATDEGVALPNLETLKTGDKTPREKAILNRLAAEVSDVDLSGKSTWNISRVVWRAGELRIKSALPYLLKMEREWSTQKVKPVELYSLLWAIGRLQMPEAVSVLSLYFKNEKNEYMIRRIAGEGLLHIVKGEERTELLTYYINRLPDEVKKAIQTKHWQQVESLLMTKLLPSKSKEYNYLTYIYALSVEHPELRHTVITLLKQFVFKPSHFRTIRHIYKLAEFREDAEITGLLSYRFDYEAPMFRMRSKRYWENDEQYQKHETYVYQIGYVAPLKELKKSDSRLAYSNKTKDYLLRRSVRMLKKAGKAGDLYYVKLAVAILCAHDARKDHISGYIETKWPRWNRWNRVQIEHPDNYNRFFLNYILYGNREGLKWSGTSWWIESAENKRPKDGVRLQQPRQSANNSYQGLLQNWVKKVTDLFKNKTESPLAVATQKDHPFSELWAQLPQAFIQLLVQGKSDEVHAFALMNLKKHPQCAEIEAKIDVKLISLFLQSGFDVPTKYGIDLANRKLEAGDTSASTLILTLTNSHLKEAREVGLKWMSKNVDKYFTDTELIKGLLFSKYDEVIDWTVEQLKQTKLSREQEDALVGRSLIEFLSYQTEDKNQHWKIQKIATFLYEKYPHILKNISTNIAYQLLNSQNSAVQAVAAQLFILQKEIVPPSQHSEAIYLGLFLSDSEFTRKTGVALFGELTDQELLDKQSILLSLCLSQYADVREAVRPIVKRLALVDAEFGKKMVDSFVPLLMRKANYEGFHEDLVKLLEESLANSLGNIDKATALNLLYSNYAPAQQFGVTLLNHHINPNDLTIRQVIAAGSHEILAARQWCWQVFDTYIDRIKEEKAEAVRLLDAKWDDSRMFAIDFFTNKFTFEDWNPDVLISIVDSVKPEVQNFGKTLVTKFFDEKEGETYLLKLSQHPTASVQIFATNYLARFASNDLEKLKGLHHYFKAVLMRVNKARVAKERVLNLLETEALRNEEFATYIGDILAEISATAAIEDKARCIDIMRKIGLLYPNVNLPIKFLEVEVRG